MELGLEVMTAEEKRDILHRRALLLAQEAAVVDETAVRIEVTTFWLGQECYALESTYIREIIPLKGYCQLPCTPAIIAGIMNLRGRILSLVDPYLLLDLPGHDQSEEAKVIVLQDGGMEFGIIVDRIEGVMRLAESEIQKELPTLHDRQRKYLAGVTNGRIILLDGKKLINDPTLVVYDEIG